jgi:uroporphyrinogen-III decarboxylase
MGIPQDKIPGFQFEQAPGESLVRRIRGMDPLSSERFRANCEALAIIAAEGEWLPVGVSIGPFSLMTKLVKDPITPIFLSGAGPGADPAGEAALLETILEAAEEMVRASCLAQIRSGAGAVLICEPAANAVFFSPNQVRQSGSRVFGHFVIEPNRRLKDVFDSHGCDLFFHDCGELIPEMIADFSVLDPAILSLGSSVALWDAAAHVPKRTVLLGNLPTKKFYSEDEMPVEKVEALARGLLHRMRASGHPFILGSECDILSMPGYEQVIMKKVLAFHRLQA